MACPFFDPAAPYSWEAWPNPPRMPLGDPHTGACSARGETAHDSRVRQCCNTGYARGICPDFPGGTAPDAVRFGIVRLDRGIATVRYVLEKDHHPFEDGVLDIQPNSSPSGSVLKNQAAAFAESYLRRNR